VELEEVLQFGQGFETENLAVAEDSTPREPQQYWHYPTASR